VGRVKHLATRYEIKDLRARYVISETQWREIKESLAERGVELATATVDEQFAPPWSRWDDSAQLPLCDVLQDWMDYTVLGRGTKLVTPKQHAEVLRKEVIALENALAMLGPADVTVFMGVWVPTSDPLDVKIKRRRAMKAAIMQEIAERREYIAHYEAAGSRSANSAISEHNDCWRDFARLWRAVTPSAGKFRRKHLRRFLLACTRPLFPEMTAQVFERKLHSFISNFFKTR
jgi:hypothetical protein